MERKIHFDVPNIGDLEREYLMDALNSRYVSTIGSYLDKFEPKFAEKLGSKGAVAMQSGTSCLHMSLYELGLGPDDEIIVPVTTFIASINPVVYVGAKPVFVDVDADTWNMDPKKIEAAISTLR